MFKTKIIKQISRIMVVLILLSGVLTLSGCVSIKIIDSPDKYRYYSRPSYDTWSSPMEMMATSDTKIFDKNNIKFDLSYSTHKLGNGKKAYEDYAENELYFAVYIAPFTGDIIPKYEPFKQYEEEGLTIDEMKNIENHIFVNGIIEKDAFSDEYAYEYTFFKCIYNHIESIIIPWDFIERSNNKISLVFIAFTNGENYSGFHIAYDCWIDMNCKEISETQVEFDFDDSFINNFVLVGY